MEPVYLTAAGSFFPGEPVSCEAMACRLGEIDALSARLGRMVLRQNRIDTRHYAIGADGQITHSNAQMAALAVRAALGRSQLSLADLDCLAAATTQGDLLVPGHASQVHAELGAGPIEIASFQSVCASSMMAAKTAWLNIACGQRRAAAAVGSEFSSRWFQPAFYEPAMAALEDREARMAAEFLRWTLSDGAGAIVLEPKPHDRAPCFKVEWIELVSLAGRFDLCMYAGRPPARKDEPLASWSHYPGGPIEAAGAGAVMLLQDMELLKRIIRAWVGEYLKLVDQGRIAPDKVDHLLCHYSAHSLREEIVRIMRVTGGMIDEDKWFTNLPSRGNTGAAALFVMLDEFMGRAIAKPGERVLCIVPESGRAMIAFMMLTAL